MSWASRISQWLPVTWFLAAVILLLLLWTSGTLGKVVQRITKFDGFGLSFEFTAQSAQQTRESVQDSLAEVRVAITRRLAADVRSANLQETFRAMLDATLLHDKSGWRSTIHIQDPLYANQLFQLLDYQPSGKGAGRTFSTRAGIIGLSWRLRRTESWNQSSAVSADELIQQWGMTDLEAESRKAKDSKKLFLAVPLRDVNGARIGIFYFDADGRERFGLSTLPEVPSEAQREAADIEEKALLSKIETEVVQEYEQRMSVKLTKVVEEIAKASPLLEQDAQ
ncbi:MAG: hypothetical protein ABIQ39_16300 [Ilumatobacteraceae bacterium]